MKTENLANLATQVFSYLDIYWGICCVPGVQASLQLWVSDLYCFVHSLGHCYTYNPPEDGLPSFEGGVGLFLGHSANLHHHQIYLHERGQFWPNENIPHLFRWKQEPNVLTKIFFQVVKYDKVSKK